MAFLLRGEHRAFMFGFKESTGITMLTPCRFSLPGLPNLLRNHSGEGCIRFRMVLYTKGHRSGCFVSVVSTPLSDSCRHQKSLGDLFTFDVRDIIFKIFCRFHLYESYRFSSSDSEWQQRSKYTEVHISLTASFLMLITPAWISAPPVCYSCSDDLNCHS